MCKNLVEKGHLDKPLIIFNRTQKRAADLDAKLPPGKSTIASSLEEAVSKADIVFTCLGDDAAIKDTIPAAVKGDVKSKIFVDCSTVHPDTTNMLAKCIQGQGAEMVACPGTTPEACLSSFSPTNASFEKFSVHQRWPTMGNSSASSLAPHPQSIK